jgi:hypothetical protein
VGDGEDVAVVRGAEAESHSGNLKFTLNSL